MTDQYVVLADVVNSRDIDDRERFRATLADTLAYVNEEYRNAIETEFDLIKGVDEFGGVLDRLSPVYEILSEVLNGVHPVRVRFGIARGNVDVNGTSGSVSDMDGTAFHRADRLLGDAESDGLYAYVDTDEPIDPILSNNINLLLMFRDRLTDRQVEITRAYERCGTQSAAAEYLDIRQQSVSESLKRADYDRLRQIRDALHDVLEAIYAG